MKVNSRGERLCATSPGVRHQFEKTLKGSNKRDPSDSCRVRLLLAMLSGGFAQEPLAHGYSITSFQDEKHWVAVCAAHQCSSARNLIKLVLQTTQAEPEQPAALAAPAQRTNA